MKTIMMKLKRLRAMSVPELFYRLIQALRDNSDKRRLLNAPEQSTEWFVSRLEGDAESIEEKFKRIYNNAKNRSAFAWQKKSRDKLFQSYEKKYAENKRATLKAAEKFIHTEFTILGKPVVFKDDINWHYDPLSDKIVPVVWWRDVDYYSGKAVREVKYVWELNRCQHFVTLGKAFLLTGDEQYADHLISQWLDWIDKNPYKMGVNWTSSLECAFRLVSWTWALQFINESSILNAGRYIRLLRSIENHVDFILGHLSKYSSANNHILGEALGLIYAGAYYPEFPRAQKWLQQGLSLFEKEFLRQVTVDGVNAEQAIWYHRYVFDFGVLAAIAATSRGLSFSPEVMLRLEKMAEFVRAIMDEAGNVPALGDDDGGQALILSELFANPDKSMLATASYFFQRKDMNPGPGEFHESTFWLFGDDGNLLESERIRHQELSVFEQGGYVVASPLNSGAQKLVFDCGPLGLGSMAAHGHADALAFTLSAGGEQLLIDSGAYMYVGAGQERKYYRSTRAHNTIVIDGLDQSDMLGPFQWGRRASCSLKKAGVEEGQFDLQASHDGYKRIGVSHTRCINRNDEAWLIIDTITGVGIHQIDAYFHFAPCEFSLTETKMTCRFKENDVRLQFQTDDDEEVRLSCTKEWYSKHFGVREKHPVLCVSVKVKLPFTLKTRIIVDAKAFH